VTNEIAPAVISGLKDFQRRTVEHAFHRLYEAEDSTQRFLVADEVGTGKTMVAKGVIAKAIDHLQREDKVQRIDIIYICSNSAIAKQNIKKLNVLGDKSQQSDTRITMLAAQVQNLNEKSAHGGKTVNLIAFTPGTSFEKGQQGGQVQERALIYSMLLESYPNRQTSLERFLRLDVKGYWDFYVAKFSDPEKVDSDIRNRFVRDFNSSPLKAQVDAMVEACYRKHSIPSSELRTARRLIGAIRSCLARASIDALEPDLVILDEFQRFKHLLEVPKDEVDADDVRQLAQQLFDYEGVRVLLLSATPYKLFTVAGEAAVSGDDHYKDFLSTTRFLLKEKPERIATIEFAFRQFRESLIASGEVSVQRHEAQSQLLKVMSRTERPVLGDWYMGRSHGSELGPPSAEELVGYAAMDQMARGIDTKVHIDYWKSAPYFLNFMDGYKVGERFKETFKQGIEVPGLKLAQVIRAEQVQRREQIEPGNARLRALQEQVIDSDLWKLLWLPPSLPYHSLGGPFKKFEATIPTKRLIFSSWNAAPNSISALLSHEVARRLFVNVDIEKNPYDVTQRLVYRKGDTQAKGMTTLALFTPIPELAEITDSFAIACAHRGVQISTVELLVKVGDSVSILMPKHPEVADNRIHEAWYWVAPFLMMTRRDRLKNLEQLVPKEQEQIDENRARHQSIDTAIDAASHQNGRVPLDLNYWVSMVGLFGPGNVAYRAARRALQGLAISEDALLKAAAIIGEGFRSLFNRPEAMALLDNLDDVQHEDYWQRVLRYCMFGDLQSVMDEFLHFHLSNSGVKSDDDLLKAAEGIRESMALKASPVNLFNPMDPKNSFHVNTRFAVRFGAAKGGAKTDEKSENRMTAVQQAFNSPFWPMVLSSTSVGQEGVDFHWWCHSLVHWNLPSNPVDIEQREGRVHRFGGHAVRKNIAQKYRDLAFEMANGSPWPAMFEAAHADRSDDVKEKLGDLWPWWVFPGEAQIETWIPSLPFSRDLEREERLRRLRAVYRVAFGQPRQEELGMLLTDGNGKFEPIDLRPPDLIRK
jgi:hypothetical protein